mmetsp:Transcript_10328/g.21211  ORF Transcript_10328/g.21211 Transcript_10328/m.21211 type:complete len:125 (+) Transcript_10328:405-779(+)
MRPLARLQYEDMIRPLCRKITLRNMELDGSSDGFMEDEYSSLARLTKIFSSSFFLFLLSQSFSDNSSLVLIVFGFASSSCASFEKRCELENSSSEARKEVTEFFQNEAKLSFLLFFVAEESPDE